MFAKRPLNEKMGLEISGNPENFKQLDVENITEYLRHHGVVVLRDFAMSVSEFEGVSCGVTPDFLVHHDVGRMFVSDDGTTQGVVPGFEYLPAHVERGYAAPIPGLLFFYCDRPARTGGETTLYDGFDIFEALSPAAQEFLVRHPILYRLRIGPDLWQRTLGTDDQAEALEILDEYLEQAVDAAIGERAACRVDGDCLEMDFITPAVRTAERRPGHAFSNSGLTFLRSLTMKEEGLLTKGNMTLLTEDEQPYPTEIFEEALAASEKVVVKLPWARGDMVVLDNRTVLHGRHAFDDPERSIFVRIGFGTV